MLNNVLVNCCPRDLDTRLFRWCLRGATLNYSGAYMHSWCRHIQHVLQVPYSSQPDAGVATAADLFLVFSNIGLFDILAYRCSSSQPCVADKAL